LGVCDFPDRSGQFPGDLPQICHKCPCAFFPVRLVALVTPLRLDGRFESADRGSPVSGLVGRFGKLYLRGGLRKVPGLPAIAEARRPLLAGRDADPERRRRMGFGRDLAEAGEEAEYMKEAS
jgi:hypothetical protein